MIFNSNLIGLFSGNRRASKENRPVVRPEMGPVDWVLEAVAIIGLMVLLGYVIYQYPRLPETIPSHFDGTGAPDEYSSKSSFLFLPGIDIFIFIFLSLIVLVPHRFNFTVKITPENALRQYAIACRLIRYLKGAVIWIFFYISYATVRVVAKQDAGLGLWFIPVILGFVIIPLIIYQVVASRHR